MRPRRTAPLVSVVVAASRWSGGLTTCLASIAAACQRQGAEVIVVCGDGPPESDAGLASGSVRHIDGAREEGLPQLRAMGMRAATGDIVLLVEPSRFAGLASRELAHGVPASRLVPPRPPSRGRGTVVRRDPGLQG